MKKEGFIMKTQEWICLCGNQSDLDGFDTCLPDGRRIEPEGPWQDHYICNRCESVVNQSTLEIAWSSRQ